MKHGITAPCIIMFSNRWRWLVSFTPGISNLRKSLWYDADDTQRYSRSGGVRKNSHSEAKIAWTTYFDLNLYIYYTYLLKYGFTLVLIEHNALTSYRQQVARRFPGRACSEEGFTRKPERVWGSVRELMTLWMEANFIKSSPKIPWSGLDLFLQSGEYTSLEEETLKLMLETHFSACVERDTAWRHSPGLIGQETGTEHWLGRKCPITGSGGWFVALMRTHHQGRMALS